MMNQEGAFGYGKGDGFQLLGLSYKGNRLSMLIVLPAKAGGLAELEKSLTAEALGSGSRR